MFEHYHTKDMRQNFLQLNPGKTEIIVFGTPSNLYPDSKSMEFSLLQIFASDLFQLLRILDSTCTALWNQAVFTNSEI